MTVVGAPVLAPAAAQGPVAHVAQHRHAAGGRHRARHHHSRKAMARRGCLKRHAVRCGAGARSGARHASATVHRHRVSESSPPLVPGRWVSWRSGDAAGEEGPSAEGSGLENPIQGGGGSGGGSGSGSGGGGGGGGHATGLSGFQPGMNAGNYDFLEVPGAVKLGAKLVRVPFQINAPASQLQSTIAAYAAVGIRVVPLASFYSTMPSGSEAQNLASWARAYGPGGTFWAHYPGTPYPIEAIEFGNETSYGYQYGDTAGARSYKPRAEAYAVRVKEAGDAIAGSGANVGLLVQADDWSGEWVNGMYAAVPELTRYVAGWVIHPYGPTWRKRLEDLSKQTAAHGAPSSIPIDITEWGLSTDAGHCLDNNYGWNPCMTYVEAATTLSTIIGEVRAMLGARLGMFMLYQIRDQQPSGSSNEREYFFGALGRENQPKGAYTTAVQALLAA
jgi:hypothetical protein